MEKAQNTERRFGKVQITNGKIEAGLKPVFLARNPGNGDLLLFLTNEDRDQIMLFGGSIEAGLHMLRPYRKQPFCDYFILDFMFNGQAMQLKTPGFQITKPRLSQEEPKADIKLELPEYRVEGVTSVYIFH